MASLNKWSGIGNCCSDPEARALPSGSYVVNLTIACNSSYKDRQTGQKVDSTEFVRIVFFNRLAEIAGEYLRKGSQVYIEGKLQTRKWQDQNGQDRYTTEIVANEMQMLGSKHDQENNHNQNNSLDSSTSSQYGFSQENISSPEGFSSPPPQAARQKLSNNTDLHGRPIYETESQGMDSFDDDIPF